jgi:hypothetical protein
MITFREFNDLEKKDDSRAMEVIKKGMNLTKDGDFWDMFLSLCGDPEGMSALLGTSREKITGMDGKIRTMMKKIMDKDSSGEGRKKMIKTGDKT